MYDDEDNFWAPADTYLYRGGVDDYVRLIEKPPFTFPPTPYGRQCDNLMRRFTQRMVQLIQKKGGRLTGSELEEMVEEVECWLMKSAKLIAPNVSVEDAESTAKETFDEIGGLNFFDYLEDYGDQVARSFLSDEAKQKLAAEPKALGDDDDDEDELATDSFEVDVERYAAQREKLWKGYLAENIATDPQKLQDELKQMDRGMLIRMLFDVANHMMNKLDDVGMPKAPKADSKPIAMPEFVMRQRSVAQLEQALRKPLYPLPNDTKFGKSCNRIINESLTLVADTLTGKSGANDQTIDKAVEKARWLVACGIPRFADTKQADLKNAFKWLADQLEDIPFAQDYALRHPEAAQEGYFALLKKYCEEREAVQAEYRAEHLGEPVQEEFDLFEDILRVGALDFVQSHVNALTEWERRESDRRRDTLSRTEMRDLMRDIKKSFDIDAPDNDFTARLQGQLREQFKEIDEALAEVFTMGEDDFGDLTWDATLRAGRILVGNSSATPEQVQDWFAGIRDDPTRKPFEEYLEEFAADLPWSDPHYYLLHREELQAGFIALYGHNDELDEALESFDENMIVETMQQVMDDAAKQFGRALTTIPQKGR